MAVWGATAAHDDDAERAVRAGLELVDMVAALGEEIGEPALRLRAGILSGEAVVGPGGNDKGLVVGDMVNTASRLQSIAEPGTVVVGESTRSLIQESISCEALGEQQVKGKAIPVAAFRALRLISEVGGRNRSDGLEPPFVGRQDELRLLKDQLHATGREGRARLISIMGEGGIGKSRLVWELLKYVDGLGDPIYWHEGRSPAYGDGVTFWALGEMVRSRAGIADTDDSGKSRLRLRTAVAEYVPDSEDQRWMEPRLAGLLGLDAMPPGDRSELFAALRTFFQRVADRGTTVLVFEDIHWADAGLLEFIEELVDRSQRDPILVVTLARPDLLERRPGWGSDRRNFMSLHLGPLTDDAMDRLVTGLVPGIPDQPRRTTVQRAAGVPLYAVELVRMLLNEGALVEGEGAGYRLIGDLAASSVPHSLQAVIGARLDRLDPADRALLQDAAVLGQSFTVDGLVGLRDEPPEAIGARLDGLVRSELLELESDPRSPERGQYRWVQAMIKEVVHGRGRASRPARRSRGSDKPQPRSRGGAAFSGKYAMMTPH